MSQIKQKMSVSYMIIFIFSILMMFVLMVTGAATSSKSSSAALIWGYTAWLMFKRRNSDLVQFYKALLWFYVVLFPISIGILIFGGSEVKRLIGYTEIEVFYFFIVTMLLTYGLFFYFKKQVSKSENENISSFTNNVISDNYWGLSAEELKNGRNEAVWAKSFATCDGDESRAKAMYLRLRAHALQQERLISKKVSDPLNGEAKNSFDFKGNKDGLQWGILDKIVKYFLIVSFGYIMILSLSSPDKVLAIFSKLSTNNPGLNPSIKSSQTNTDKPTNESIVKCNQGWSYMNPERSHLINYTKAYNLNKEAYDLGNFEGANNIGLLYEKGLGVLQSYDSAIYWYEIAMSNSWHSAQAELGLIRIYLLHKPVTLESIQKIKKLSYSASVQINRDNWKSSALAYQNELKSLQSTLDSQINVRNLSKKTKGYVQSKPDKKALAWQKRNSWFGSNKEMTGYAMLIHESLSKSQMIVGSDVYYLAIDKSLHAKYPLYFDNLKPMGTRIMKKEGNI